MLILDTNVLSELGRGPAAHPVAQNWFGSLLERPSTSVICEAELLTGIALLPAGARRDWLEQTAEKVIGEMQDVLPFDRQCAAAYALIMASRRALGRPISFPDAQIAATALVHGAVLATRNVKDFDGLGISLVNPWDPAAPPQTD